MARLLVIDEDSRTRLAIVRLLRSALHDAEQASDGLDAIRRHREQPYDLVVLDVSIPAERSLWTLRKLVQDDPEVRVLVLAEGTPATREEMLQLGMALGAGRALPKPVDLRAFLEAVVALLTRA